MRLPHKIPMIIDSSTKFMSLIFFLWLRLLPDNIVKNINGNWTRSRFNSPSFRFSLYLALSHSPASIVMHYCVMFVCVQFVVTCKFYRWQLSCREWEREQEQEWKAHKGTQHIDDFIVSASFLWCAKVTIKPNANMKMSTPAKNDSFKTMNVRVCVSVCAFVDLLLVLFFVDIVERLLPLSTVDCLHFCCCCCCLCVDYKSILFCVCKTSKLHITVYCVTQTIGEA